DSLEEQIRLAACCEDTNGVSDHRRKIRLAKLLAQCPLQELAEVRVPERVDEIGQHCRDGARNQWSRCRCGKPGRDALSDVICRTFGRSTSDVRKLRSTKRPMARPILSLLFGMMAVWGIGNRSGRRLSAVTANQSAIPPTMPASAPDWMSSVTNPGPGTIRVATKTTPMPASIVVARIRVRPRRLPAASSDPGRRRAMALVANAAPA